METVRRIARWLLAAALLFTAAGSLRAADPLQEARELYATAAYDESLAALARLDDPALADQIDEYRALCLIALHRDGDAGLTVERLVRRHPVALEHPADRSPKFVELYQAVWRRLVPELAVGAYDAAKASFEAKDYSAAARQFGAALELLRNATETASLRDLTRVAGEFRDLAEQRLAAIPPQPAPEPERQATRQAADPSPAPTPVAALLPPPASIAAPFAPIPRVYDAADLDVTPPVAVEQAMPPWNPPWDYAARNTYNGRLQIVVGDDGAVKSAEILRQSFSVYDGLLLNAVKKWRYLPAQKRNQPVQYPVDHRLRVEESGAVVRPALISARPSVPVGPHLRS